MQTSSRVTERERDRERERLAVKEKRVAWKEKVSEVLSLNRVTVSVSVLYRWARVEVLGS